ncbi:uncharacterized protein LOC141660381 [Apium graveolens]|uniref:uncharacterized protein LOC141660381 n=1 Tax=Apium graveolens TaxID=4045 RepID=UPI003D7BF3EC
MLKLLPNIDFVDALDIFSRVFKLKLDQLLDLIKKKNYFGKCIGVIHVIEFQKRGLPHVHMLIWLSPESRPNSIEKVDRLVFAEIPDKNSDPITYGTVKNYMMHGPCGKDLNTSPCMMKGKCMRHFPKRFNGNNYFNDYGFPVYRRRNTGRVINKKGINPDNQHVVPYNRDLMLRFQCHINLEICNSLRSLKYLFKYCLKGHDTATMMLKKKSNKSGNEQTTRFVKNLDEKTAKWKLRQIGDVVGRLAEVHATTAMPTQIRAMFVNILANYSVSDPLALWEKHWPSLLDDVLYMRRKISDNIHLTLSEYEIQNYVLAEIEKLLNDVGKSLRDFHMMPFPDQRFFHTFVNHLIVEETNCNKEELRLNHEKAHKNLNARQLDVYNAVIDNVNKNKGGMFFVYKSGGCGSGIAATLLPSGRIAHSRFKIPLKLDQSSISGIKHGTDIAELMQHTSLIIWDEALIQYRYAFEAVDRSLRDIIAVVDVERGKRPFSGIIVVFGGDI